MSTTVTGLNGQLITPYAAGRAVTRALPALPGPKNLSDPAAKITRVQPDPPRQGLLIEHDPDQSHKGGLRKTGADQKRSPVQIENKPFRSGVTLFIAQILGQSAEDRQGYSDSALNQGLQGHRDGAALGSDLYRRAGGEPALLSDRPAFLSLSV